MKSLIFVLLFALMAFGGGVLQNVNVKIYDSITGKYKGLIFDAGSLPRIAAQDYLEEIAEGNVAGHTPWFKTGYNDAIGTDEETMWSYSTQYSWITTAGQIQVVSDVATDTVGGVGARTVRVGYLKSDYNEAACTLLVKARTQVASGASHADVWRINSFRVLTTGDSCKALGNLILSQVTGGKVVSYIRAKKTRARTSVYTVPLGKTLYISSISFSCAGTKYLVFTTHANVDNITGSVLQRGLFYPYHEITLLNSSYNKTLEIPTKLQATTDLKVSVFAEASGSIGTCALRGWIE